MNQESHRAEIIAIVAMVTNIIKDEWKIINGLIKLKPF